jgi:hypothetical protein
MGSFPISSKRLTPAGVRVAGMGGAGMSTYLGMSAVSPGVHAQGCT